MVCTQAVTNILSEAGWFAEREIEIKHYVEFLKNDDYNIFERAIQFLKEYGGLKIQFKNPRKLDQYLILNTDPEHAGESIFRELAARYEQHCNESFVILGEIASIDMTWYIGSSGKFYGGNDDFLICLGDNFDEALFHVVSGAKLDMITIDSD
ncbi:SUKH-3 domain-containing protein [Paenibacillus sp. E222]|uniref:SUKH-3 domain-containing protein n=1 Tax=Paenibacillus sp. E222 TaxID=2748863 RepID=UPI00211B8427|nr:SUKH-3 domain-containing protein [Paenibacillus sp. E222]